jgi:hypothetical protein
VIFCTVTLLRAHGLAINHQPCRHAAFGVECHVGRRRNAHGLAACRKAVCLIGLAFIVLAAKAFATSLTASMPLLTPLAIMLEIEAPASAGMACHVPPAFIQAFFFTITISMPSALMWKLPGKYHFGCHAVGLAIGCAGHLDTVGG